MPDALHPSSAAPREFTTTVTLDLSTYREFNRLSLCLMPAHITLQCIFLGYLAVYVLLIAWTGTPLGFPTAAGILLLFLLALLLTNRKGGLRYRQMLSVNNDQPPRNRLTIRGDTIYAVNLDTGNRNSHSLEKIRRVGESQNLIVLMMDHRLAITLDKRTLTGGTADELTAWLLAACPNLQKRTLQTGRAARVRAVAFAVLFCIGLALSLR